MDSYSYTLVRGMGLFWIGWLAGSVFYDFVILDIWELTDEEGGILPNDNKYYFLYLKSIG
jgi:hypothetical protein